MGTRCNIHFNHGDETVANIYRHWDGYPEAVLPDLQRFFQDVKAQTNDTRFGDAEYLSAKFLVWSAAEACKATKHSEAKAPLAFTGFSPCVADHGDIEYVYTVDCDKHDSEGHPETSVTDA